MMRCLLAALLALAPVANASPVMVAGERFVDEAGRELLLRGINVAGHAKLPPYRHDVSAAQYQQLAAWGLNTVRLLWIWEAFEPAAGVYDWSYLADYREQVRRAAAAGLYTIVDFHQDAYSRFHIGGCGDGFPLWTLPAGMKAASPRNGESCKGWGARMLTDRAMHRAWSAFHGNRGGVRDRFLAMVGVVAATLRDEPLVIGYDLMNEPWGRPGELVRFWEDAGNAVRREHAAALLFISPHAISSSGLPTFDRRPKLERIVYSPHYYDSLTVTAHTYLGMGLRVPFAQMHRAAKRWGAPLFVGEFGASPAVRRQDAYRRHLYDALDRLGASGAQWNFTPAWSPEAKDGWNREDFNITDELGRLRPNFRPRPYPQAIPGVLERLSVREDAKAPAAWVEIEWHNEPGRGDLRVYLPATGAVHWVGGNGLHCHQEERYIRCEAKDPGAQFLRIWAPPPAGSRRREGGKEVLSRRLASP